MSAFGLSRVIALLHTVDDLLEDGPPIAIRVGGGAAMMLHNPSRLTEDVDVFDRVLPPELREAAIRVARSEGIPDSRLDCHNPPETARTKRGQTTNREGG